MAELLVWLMAIPSILGTKFRRPLDDVIHVRLADIDYPETRGSKGCHEEEVATEYARSCLERVCLPHPGRLTNLRYPLKTSTWPLL